MRCPFSCHGNESNGNNPYFCQLYEINDLSKVRHHIEFNRDENETVRDRLTVFTIAHCIKFIDQKIKKFFKRFYIVFIY